MISHLMTGRTEITNSTVLFLENNKNDLHKNTTGLVDTEILEKEVFINYADTVLLPKIFEGI